MFNTFILNISLLIKRKELHSLKVGIAISEQITYPSYDFVEVIFLREKNMSSNAGNIVCVCE